MASRPGTPITQSFSLVERSPIEFTGFVPFTHQFQHLPQQPLHLNQPQLLQHQKQVRLLDTVTDGRMVMDQIRELRPDVLMVDALLQGKVNGLEFGANPWRP